MLVDGRVVGIVGELHPRWRQGWDLPHPPMLFELELDAALARPLPVAQPVPKHQAVERDIAVVVAEATTHDEVMAAIHAASTGGLLRDAALFDIFRPQATRGAVPAITGGLADGEKSMAVRLSFSSDNATLTDEQIEPAVRAIIEQLSTRVNARLRG